MKQRNKILFTTFFIIIFIFLPVIWGIGIIADFSVVPSIKTYYTVKGTNTSITNGYTLKKTGNTIIKLEIPNEFLDNDKCFDISFSSTKGTQILTVNDFSQTLFDKDKFEIKRENSYLFWNNGSKSETFKIDNYEIKHPDNYNKKKYIFFRTVFNIANNNEFAIKIKTNFYIDNKSNKLIRLYLLKRNIE